MDELNKKIEIEDLSHRIKTQICSLLKLDVPNESFDIIWAEGALDLIGYVKSFNACNRLLKVDGFLVAHNDVVSMKQKLKNLSGFGFKLIDTFSLPESAWWEEYYKPLEIRLEELRPKYKNDPQAHSIFKRYQREIDMVKKAPQDFSSAFFIMQKDWRRPYSLCPTKNVRLPGMKA